MLRREKQKSVRRVQSETTSLSCPRPIGQYGLQTASTDMLLGELLWLPSASTSL